MIMDGSLGNSPHKFVWHNREPEEFREIVRGKYIGNTRTRGRWMMTHLEPGYSLVVGEAGGSFVLHQPGEKLPNKYHLSLAFEDGSFLTATTAMWGAYEVYEEGLELEREYIKDMRPAPLDAGFTREYFGALVDELMEGKKRSVKSLLTQDQLIPGLGNAIAQDIMFKAGLHPKLPINALDDGKRNALYETIHSTVVEIIEAGGRYDETDFFGNPGTYVRLMDKNAKGKPCPVCSTEVIKIQYLGGACYFCPNCQPLP